MILAGCATVALAAVIFLHTRSDDWAGEEHWIDSLIYIGMCKTLCIHVPGAALDESPARSFSYLFTI